MQTGQASHPFFISIHNKKAKSHRHFQHGDTDTNMYQKSTSVNFLFCIFCSKQCACVFSLYDQLNTIQLNGKVNHRIVFLFICFCSMKKIPSLISSKIISFKSAVNRNVNKQA